MNTHAVPLTIPPSGRRILFLLSLGAAILAPGLAAQAAPGARRLYEPRNLKQAYARGTRARDGMPGPDYWQNHGRYAITIAAAPPDRTIHGSERITYFNESPDTLRGLVVKLFMNVHKPTAPRSGATSPDFLTSGVHIDAFSVDGAEQTWKDSPRYATWQPVRLPGPLAPHDSVRLSFDWHYELAKQASREGVIDSTTFYVAYFYPRVAVYDDYEGWDVMDHTGSQEFYSDFNDYDVTVRVPTGFLVWGTGTLENPDSLLQAGPLARYRASFTSDSTLHIATREDLAAGAVTKGGGSAAWHFASRDIPDVAFGLSDHYDWDAGSVVVDDATGRRAGVQAAYDDTAADFRSMVRFGRHALDWLSHHWPGVPYPYEKTTIFQGGAGMEYPMMVNDGSYPDTTMSRFVAEHEIAHTYMPFYMGINETRYGFMDEGWATTFEHLIGGADMGREAADNFFKQFRVSRWARDPLPEADLPIVTPGDALLGAGLGINEYGKAALGYLAVKDLLGDETFRLCLHAYMDRWHGKHPSPWDFFYTFDDVAGRDLDWFWSGWFFSHGYIDLAVAGVDPAPGGYAVTIRNIGGMPAPVDIVLHFADGTTQTRHESPAIWQADPARATVSLEVDRPLASLELDGGIWVDFDPSNNAWNGTQR